MELVLSHSIEIGCLNSTLISCSACFIQRICVQHDVAAMYFVSSSEKEIEDYFLLNEDTK
jgi:hypothetical protein